jgi:hypothetical protein
MQLDVKDEEDRALLHAMPLIAAALIPHIAHDPKRLAVIFSSRRHDTPVRVLIGGEAHGDPAVARALEGAPAMPNVRVVALRRDGTITCHDARITELTEMEETAPS